MANFCKGMVICLEICGRLSLNTQKNSYLKYWG